MRLVFFILSFLLTVASSAQSDSLLNTVSPQALVIPPPPKSAFFIELGGNGGIYSLNYDRILINKKSFRTSGRLGFALMPVDRSVGLVFVGEHNFLFGTDRHFIEAGAGMNYYKTFVTTTDTYANLSSNNDQWIVVTRLGYRFQDRLERGFFFRAAITPIVAETNSAGTFVGMFQFWAGVGIGANI